MFTKFKKWYFRFGVLVCADDNEAKAARDIMEKHNCRIVRNDSWRGKLLINGMVPPIYQYMAKFIYVFGARNLDQALIVLDEFKVATCGFTMSENPAIVDLM